MVGAGISLLVAEETIKEQMNRVSCLSVLSLTRRYHVILGKPLYWERFGGRIDEKRDRKRVEPVYETARQAHRMAKDQNGVSRCAQPTRVEKIPDENPEARRNGRPGMLRQYIYTNAQGQEIHIRHDTARSYDAEDGRGRQRPHFNAGPKGAKLHQHYYYPEQSGDKNNNK